MEETIKANGQITKRPFWRESSNLFVIKIILVYVGWKVVFHFLHNGNGALQHEWTSIIKSFGSFYATITSWILNAIGQPTYHSGIAITFIKSVRTILVEEHCLAIPAMVMFTACIILFTGSWKNKIWFIPFGLMAIMAINIIRLVFLSLSFVYMSERFYHLHHSLIYVVITYALILLLIYWWMKKFSDEPAENNTK